MCVGWSRYGREKVLHHFGGYCTGLLFEPDLCRKANGRLGPPSFKDLLQLTIFATASIVECDFVQLLFEL